MSQGYDGDRLRGKKIEGGVSTYYFRSSVLGSQVVAEHTGGGWARGYVYGAGGEIVAQQQEGTVHWVHADPVTKEQQWKDTQGNWLGRIVVDPWGGEAVYGYHNQQFTYNSYKQPRKYTTYHRDANGGDEAQHRRYQAAWSRFDQPDPYDGSYSLTDPQSFNRYAYVNNDPVNFTDPSGLDGIDIGLAGTVTVNGGSPGSIGTSFAGLGVLGGGSLLDLPLTPNEDGGGDGAPNTGDDDAGTIEYAVEAALNVLQYGCYDSSRYRDNPDIKPFNSNFATISNPEKYTKDWKNVRSSHGGDGAKENPNPFKIDGLEYTIKYYPAGGGDPALIAITRPTSSTAHYGSAAVFWLGGSVNLNMAKIALAGLPKCRPDPY